MNKPVTPVSVRCHQTGCKIQLCLAPLCGPCCHGDHMTGLFSRADAYFSAAAGESKLTAASRLQVFKSVMLPSETHVTALAVTGNVTESESSGALASPMVHLPICSNRRIGSACLPHSVLVFSSTLLLRGYFLFP